MFAKERWAVVLAATVLVLSACGTRLANSAFTTIGPANSGGANANANTNVPGLSGPTASGPGGAASGGGAASASGSNNASGASGGGASAGGATAGSGNASTGAAAQSGANLASDIGVTPTTLRIGNVTGVSGALGPDAFGVTLRGVKIWAAATNARGGINGRKIDLHACDDAQDGAQNLACTQSLVEQDKVFVLLGNNSLSSGGSASYEYKKGIPDLGFPLNNGYYKYPNMFSYLGSQYPRDGKHVGDNDVLTQQTGIFRWFKQQRHIDRAAYFFYSQSASQEEGYLLEQGGKAEGITQVYEGGGSHQGENIAAPNFDSDVITMKSMGANAPQAMFDAMDVNGNQKLCTSMDRYGFTVIAKVSTVEVQGQSIGTPAWSRPCRDSIYIGGASDSYANASDPVVSQYLADYKAYGNGATQHQWTLEGWAVGLMFTDAVSSMGAAPTRKGFINYFDSLDNYTVHGLFSPEDWKYKDPNGTWPNCNTVVQWQDSVGTFVTRAGVLTCYTTKWYGSAVQDDV